MKILVTLFFLLISFLALATEVPKEEITGYKDTLSEAIDRSNISCEAKRVVYRDDGVVSINEYDLTDVGRVATYLSSNYHDNSLVNDNIQVGTSQIIAKKAQALEVNSLKQSETQEVQKNLRFTKEERSAKGSILTQTIDVITDKDMEIVSQLSFVRRFYEKRLVNEGSLISVNFKQRYVLEKEVHIICK